MTTVKGKKDRKQGIEKPKFGEKRRRKEKGQERDASPKSRNRSNRKKRYKRLTHTRWRKVCDHIINFTISSIGFLGIAEFLFFFFFFKFVGRTYGRLSFRGVWARRDGDANFSSTCVERRSETTYWGKKGRTLIAIWFLLFSHARIHAYFLSPDLFYTPLSLPLLHFTLALSLSLSYALARYHTTRKKCNG